MELADLAGPVADATAPLHIAGGQSKLVPADQDAVIDVSGFSGIIDYEPKELIVRARAGTTIQALIDTLAAEGQVLGFDPPSFDGRATLGGTIASGLAGARRPWFGAGRDFVLGVGLIDGAGEYVEFGGQVMKNVAGFDVSRLMCGAWGTLGVIADVSLKTLPAPETEITLMQLCDRASAHQKMLQISNRSVPVSGLAWLDGQLHIRLSGARPAVESARQRIGGDTVEPVWESLADLSYFEQAQRLWRVSVAPSSDCWRDDAAVLDWGGALRWIVDAKDPIDRVEGGHAMLVFDRPRSIRFRQQRLTEPLAGFHRRLKATFDPRGIFNPAMTFDGQ